MRQGRKKLLTITLIFVILITITSCKNNKVKSEDAKRSVVTIVCGIDVKKGILTSDVIVGSGFCYKPGRIITNYHNIQDNAENINVITYDNLTVAAKVIAKDEKNDIALLEIDADIPSLSFGNTDKCEIGQTAINIATPVSAFLKGTYSEGLITNLNIVGFGTQSLIQTDINLSPGCSGSPLFDSDYNVIGMVTFKSTEFGAEGLGFAIPANRLQQLIERLDQGITTPDLKIIFQSDIYQKFGIPGAKGLVVQEVSEDSPAQGQLQAGDLITIINGNAIRNLVEYTNALEQCIQNQNIEIKIIRNSQEQTVIIEGGSL